MARFKAILFDYDDSLVDSFPARVIAARRAVDGILDPGLDIDTIMGERAGYPRLKYRDWCREAPDGRTRLSRGPF